MSGDTESKVRRQAAWATFETHLKPEQRIEALWILEKGYQKGDMNTLINYVTKVGERYGFSDDKCKKLYYEYFKLIKSKDADSLPDDPLPLMRKVRQDLISRRQHQQQLNGAANSSTAGAVASTPQAKAPVRRRETPAERQKARGVKFVPDTPAFAQTQQPKSTAASQAGGKAAPRRKQGEDPKKVIFDFMMSRLVEYYEGSQDQLFIKMIEKVGSAGLTPEASGQFSSWMSSPHNHHWRSAMSNESMSSLLQLLLMSMIDLIGKQETEQLLKRVVAESNELVEAKDFSPDSLL